MAVISPIGPLRPNFNIAETSTPTPRGPLRPISETANHAIAEKIAGRILVVALHHASEPDIVLAFASDEIRLALDAASRRPR